MPPPVGRYGPSALNTPFGHLQQAHQLQQQQTQQQQSQSQHHAAHTQSVNAALPPPSLGGHPGFSAVASSSTANPFGLGSTNGVGAFGADAANGTGLASHAAQMGFVRGAQMQQQALHQAQDGRLLLEGKANPIKTRIRDVWKHNLAQEMAVLRRLVERYPYISMVCITRYFDDIYANMFPTRTPNSLVLSLDRWARSQQKQTTTIKPYVVMSIFSK